jgi:xylulokinase
MLALGLDSSTQSLTAVLLDVGSGRIVHQHALNFDRDLPAFGTRNGVLPNADPAIVHAPPLLWVAALDRMLSELGQTIDVSQVAVIAGSAQQHGSVYLQETCPAVLANLRSDVPLVAQLEGVFARATSPIWMDSSTTEDCRAIDAALGGPAETQRITGSAAYERFTGPQIRRFARTEPQAWTGTAHVRLISSFLASVLAGRLVGTDWGDGSGMNLLDLASKRWHAPALAAVAADLERRLGQPEPPAALVGCISPALAQRYGFSPDCRLLPWTGDNPSSAIGLGLVQDGSCAISLGTSDVLFAVSAARPAMPPAGHTFISPTGDHMALFCFANGSLAREAVKNAHGLDWDGFAAALGRTPPGNAGRLMLPWFRPEIVPKVLQPGVVRIGYQPDEMDAEVRAVVEAQFLSMRLRAEAAGIRPRALRATGGAAQAGAILQIAADILQCPVSRSAVTNTAALGAAVRACAAGCDGAWDAVVASAVLPQLGAAIMPRPGAAEVYATASLAYGEAERRVLAVTAG